jgi:hypothetical protein
MRRQLLALGTAVLVLGVMAAPGRAAPLSITPPVLVSGASPFAPGCGGSAEGSVPGANFNYQNAETEPWLAVSPTNPNDVAAFWQQELV